MVSESRFTASLSTPGSEPTVADLLTDSVVEAAKAGTAFAAAAEEETFGGARALGDLVDAADTDDAAAEEETFGGARKLGDPGEAADTDATATEDVEARALGDPVEAADTDVAAAGEDTSRFAFIK